LYFATVDLLSSQRLHSELPELRIAEEHDRKSARLPLLVHDENDFVNSLSEWLEVRLECLDRRTRVEISDIDLKHWHGMYSCSAIRRRANAIMCALRRKPHPGSRFENNKQQLQSAFIQNDQHIQGTTSLNHNPYIKASSKCDKSHGCV
jgi:hypothetical protein